MLRHCPSAVGKYALVGLLPEQQQTALFSLLDVLALLCRKVIMKADLDGLHTRLVQALHRMEVCFPCSMMYIKMHNLVHMVEKIRLLGPLYLTAMWAYERSYRTFKALIKSRRHPVASLAQNLVAFNMAVLCKAEAGSELSHDASGLFDAVPAAAPAAGASFLAPYAADDAGNWLVETSQGRLRRVELKSVGRNTPQYLHMHHYMCVVDDGYDQLFTEFMTNFLPTVATPMPRKLQEKHQWHALSEDIMRQALASWPAWGEQQGLKIRSSSSARRAPAQHTYHSRASPSVAAASHAALQAGWTPQCKCVTASSCAASSPSGTSSTLVSYARCG
jgi:hypothetical protein